MIFVRKVRRTWPPTRSILSDFSSSDVNNSDKWDIDDWKQYVEFLNKSGTNLLKELERTKARLDECTRKLSRRKKGQNTGCARHKTILEEYLEPPKKRSRRKSYKWIIAMEALQLQKGMSAEENRKVKREEALNLCFELHNWKRSERPTKREEGNILNYMSKLKKHNK